VANVKPIRSHRHPAPAFLALLASLGAFAAVPGAASADCCLGPGVMVVLEHWTPLTAELHPTVQTDEPDHAYRATIRAYLKVGGRRIARLNEVTVSNVTTSTPMRVTFRVSARERAAAARYGARTHHRHGTITFVVHAVDQVTGQPAFARMPYGIDGFVTLPRVR
jgi:hypothetical protein